jgi:hypothetical protein
VYPTTKLLRGIARVSIKNEGTRENNYGIGIAASVPDRITPGTLFIGRSNDKNGVYPTTVLLNCVARESIKNEGTREINYGNCFAASRPDRITPGNHLIGRSNDKYGVYPTTQLLNSVARVSIKNKGTREINYGNFSQIHAPTELPPVLIL